MRDRMLLFLLIGSYLAYTTVLALIQPIGSHSPLLKGLLLVAFILTVLTSVKFPFRKTGLSGNAVIMFVLYGVFILYTLGLCFVSEAPISSITESFKFYLRIGFLFTLVIWASRSRRIRLVVEFPIALGSILALQGLLLWMLLSAGVSVHPGAVQIYEPAGGGNPYVSFGYGLLGFGDNIGWESRSIFAWRLQSYFTESSKFALFLIYPMFLSSGLYRIRRQRQYLVCAILMAAAIVATFSLGAYAAIGSASLVLLYYYLRRWVPRMLRWALAFGCVVCLALAIYSAIRFSEQYVPEDPTSNFNRIPAFAQKGSFGERKRVDTELLTLFLDYPFGLSLIDTYNSKLLGYGDFSTPNAFTFVLSRAGFVGVGIFLIIFGIAFWRFMLPQLRKECIGRYVCIATIAVWIHSVSYGNWLDLSFFYPLGIVMAMREIEERQRRDKRGFLVPENGSSDKQRGSNAAWTESVQDSLQRHTFGGITTGPRGVEGANSRVNLKNKNCCTL